MKNNILSMVLKNKQRSASVLLLALMIMSVILSSTLYINILSIRSMHQAKNIDNSVVAFYGAESGNEQAIYYIRKVDDFDTTTLVFSPEVPNLNSVLTIDSLISRKVDDSVTNILISLKKNEVYQLDAFDQNYVNVPSKINYLRLSWNSDPDCSDAKIELTANEWDPSTNDWVNPSNQHIRKCLLSESPAMISNNSGNPCDDIILDGDMTYQFRFKALGCDIYNLSIKAFYTPSQQVDFQNIYSIESVGEFPVNTDDSNRQALRVNLRKASPLSGLFDYVLFSEKSLVKNSGISGGWFSENLFISTNSLPEAREGSSYSYGLRAINGKEPYHWSWVASEIGLSIDENTGVISGIPNTGTSGNYLIVVTVKDSHNPTPASDTKTLFLKVNNP